MKKLLVISFLLVISGILFGIKAQAGYYYIEANDSSSIYLYGQEIIADYSTWEGIAATSIEGFIHSSGDDDSYQFQLFRYGEVKIILSYSEYNFSYNLCLVYYAPDSLAEQRICGSQLTTGVMLTPGHYYIEFQTNAQVYYGNYYSYILDIIVDPDAYHEENYQSFNVYDEIVDNMKLAVWTNDYDPVNSLCLQPGDCSLFKYYDEEYLYQRIYAYDPHFMYFMSSIFYVLAENMEVLYDENLRIQDTYDTISNTIAFVAEVGITAYLQNKELASIVTKVTDVAIDLTFNKLAHDAIETLNNYEVYDQEFLGVSMVNNDYFCDLNGDGLDDDPDTEKSLECIAEKTVKEYYDISAIENILMNMYKGQTLGEFTSLLRTVSDQLLMVAASMDEDDQKVINIYKGITKDLMTARLVAYYTGISYDVANSKNGSNGVDAPFSNRYLNNDLVINNLIGTDYGDFQIYRSSSDEYNDGIEPNIFFLKSATDNKNNYINFDNVIDRSQLMLIEIGTSPTVAKSMLEYGAVAYDLGKGFLHTSVDSTSGFDRYYDYRNGDVGTAIFKASDMTIPNDPYQVRTKEMFYLTYRWEYPYKKWEYKYQDNWQFNTYGTSYFAYPHGGLTYQPNSSLKYNYSATNAAQFYFRRENFKYYDYPCFNIYRKRNKLLVFSDDVFVKTACYYIDEAPSSTNVNDYDYKTYYTSSSIYSMASIYIGNYWNETNIEGATRRVYMDERADVSLGEYFVKTITKYEDYNIKYVNDSYLWATSPLDGKVNDYFYFYYPLQSGTYTDAYGVVRSSSSRYPASYTSYYNNGYYTWVVASGTYYFVNQPASTQYVMYTSTTGERRMRFEKGPDEP